MQGPDEHKACTLTWESLSHQNGSSTIPDLEGKKMCVSVCLPSCVLRPGQPDTRCRCPTKSAESL